MIITFYGISKIPPASKLLHLVSLGADLSEGLIEVCFSISLSSAQRLSQDPFPPGDSSAPSLLPWASEQRDVDSQSSPAGHGGAEQSRGTHEAVAPCSAVQRQRCYSRSRGSRHHRGVLPTGSRPEAPDPPLQRDRGCVSHGRQKPVKICDERADNRGDIW